MTTRRLLPEASTEIPASFGEFNPGRGFTVGKGEYGKLNLSGYMAARYLNQLPPDQTATDHLGRPIAVDPRQDFQFHRVMLFSQGWLFSPKFQYQTFVWTVQDTNQVAVGGALTYKFNKYADAWNGLERLSWHTVSAGLSPVLGILRPGDGGRILPAVLLARRLRPRESCFHGSSTGGWSETTTATWTHQPPRSTGTFRPAAR